LRGHDGKNSPTPELLNLVIQKEQVVLNVEAAPTESLSNGNLDFPDKQVIKLR
jgi:hypothetical protein